MKTHWKKEFNYDYMGSYSLPDGKDVVLTIKETKKEKVTGQNGKKEDCFVCYFKESDKPMILNRTNCKTIERLYKAPYIEDWIGLRVQLGVDTVNAFGEVVEALRIRNIKPAPVVAVDYSAHEAKLKACKNLEELKATFTSFTPSEQSAMVALKDTLKNKLS
jgi:cobalamin biosynthesis protein CbiG